MRMFLLCAFLLCGIAATLQSAPVSAQEKRVPAKWEYAELAYRDIPARPGGKDRDGNEVAGAPAGMSIRWTTGAGEINVKGWDELAEKLKSPLKKDSATLQKIQVLNLLGGDGWELVEQQSSATTPGGNPAPSGFVTPGGRGAYLTSATMLFKRRVP